jgi:hypothetical protein
MSGKGDKQRPCKVSYEEYSDNWDRIFNKAENEIHTEASENVPRVLCLDEATDDISQQIIQTIEDSKSK